MPLIIDGREIPLEIESQGPDAIGLYLAPKIEVIEHESPVILEAIPDVKSVSPTETDNNAPIGENGD